MELITPFSTFTTSHLRVWCVGRSLNLPERFVPLPERFFRLAWTIRSDKKNKYHVLRLQELVMLLRGCRFVVQLVIKLRRVYADMNESSGILPLLRAKYIINRHNSRPFSCLNDFSYCLERFVPMPERFFRLAWTIRSVAGTIFPNQLFVKRLNLNVESLLQRRNIIIL